MAQTEPIPIKTNCWMASLPDSANITQLTIPGTHDSCADKFMPYGRCQTMPLKEQLTAGVRFLDIRCRHIRDRFAIHHGPYYLKLHFDEVVRICTAFLQNNPSEAIILSVNSEYKSKNNTQTFEETLAAYIEPASRFFYTQRAFPALGDIRGKIVLFSRYGGNTIGIDAAYWEDKAVFRSPNRMYVQDQYWVPVSQNNKWTPVKKMLECAETETKSGVLCLNYCSGTNAGAPNAVKIIAKHTNKRLYGHCKTQRNRQYGIVVLDYPEQPEKDLLKTLIALNFDSCNM